MQAITTTSNSAFIAQGRPKLLIPRYVVEGLFDKGVPFLFGMLTMYLLQLCSPSIQYYTSMAARLLRLTVICSIISACACWYAGALSAPTFSQVGAFLRCFTNRLAQIPIAIAIPSTTPLSPPSARDHTPSPTSRRSQSPIRNGRTGPRTRSELSELPTARSEHEESFPLTNVKPFFAPVREEVRRSQADAKFSPKVANDRSPERPAYERPISENSTLRSWFPRKAARRGTTSAVTTPQLQPSAPRRNSSGSFRNDSDVSKGCRPLPHAIKTAYSQESDLPLAHEMRLRSMAMADGYNTTGYHDELDALSRNDTIMSKKSVLGTRANYSKFLANVSH